MVDVDKVNDGLIVSIDSDSDSDNDGSYYAEVKSAIMALDYNKIKAKWSYVNGDDKSEAELSKLVYRYLLEKPIDRDVIPKLVAIGIYPPLDQLIDPQSPLQQWKSPLPDIREEHVCTRIDRSLTYIQFTELYHVINYLGSGCSGIVYRAQRKSDGKYVALKFDRSLEYEFEMLSKVQGIDGVVKLINYHHVQDLIDYEVIVMEYIETKNNNFQLDQLNYHQLVEIIQIICS